jgi:hypothetical protein
MWLMMVAIMFGVLFYAATVKAEEDPILQVRTQIIAGILIGIDLKQATNGLPSMSPEQAYNIAIVLEKATNKCKDLECILNKLGLLIGKIREQKSRPLHPLEGRIIR